MLDYLNNVTESGDYYNDTQVDLYLYARANYPWHSNCTAKGHTNQEIYEILRHVSTIKILFLLSIAIAFSQWFICGCMLNFLILTPYLKAAIWKKEEDIISHHNKLLSG